MLSYFLFVTNQLFVSLRFEKKLAAEALRINENDADKALDLLTDPEQNCILQVILCTVLELILRYSAVVNSISVSFTFSTKSCQRRSDYLAVWIIIHS